MRWNQFGRLARGFGTCGDVTQDHKMRAELACPIRRIYALFSTALSVPSVSSLYKPGLTLRCTLLYQHILCHFRHMLLSPPFPSAGTTNYLLSMSALRSSTPLIRFAPFEIRHAFLGNTIVRISCSAPWAAIRRYPLPCLLQTETLRFAFCVGLIPFCQLSCLNQWLQ